MKKTFRGCIALLCGTIIWGCAFVAQSVGMEHIGPFTFQAIRCFLGVLTLLPVIFISDLRKAKASFVAGWRSPALWRAGILCGTALFAASSLQQVGLIDTDAGKAGFLTAMYIVIVPLLGLFFRKIPSKGTIFSVIIAVIGLYLLSYAGVAKVNIGDIYMILCAVAFAVQITLIDQLGSGLDGLRLNCIQCLVCAVLSAVIMAFTETLDWSSIGSCWLPLCYAGILSMGVAYTLQIIGQQNLDSTPASLIMSLESVFAALAGWLVLHERMSATEITGCVLMFAAVVSSQLPTPATKSPKPVQSITADGNF